MQPLFRLFFVFCFKKRLKRVLLNIMVKDHGQKS